MESNDSPEIPDRGETSDIPGLPSGVVGGGREAGMKRGREVGGMGCKTGKGSGRGKEV